MSYLERIKQNLMTFAQWLDKQSFTKRFLISESIIFVFALAFTYSPFLCLLIAPMIVFTGASLRGSAEDFLEGVFSWFDL